MTHFFIVLEGLDGSGKSEISRRLAALLSESLGADHVLLTYEPHNPSAAGEYIRDVLAKRIVVSSRTLALAFAVNRADHTERVIDPFLDGEKRVIVCDRYVMSSLVYQSTGGLSVDDVMDLNQSARRPDLTLFLDVTPETAAQRIGQRQDHRELFEDRFAETRAKYQRVIAYLHERGEAIERIDANGTPIEVLNGMIETLKRCAPDWLRLEKVNG
jgi:dTMP kinase